MYKCSNAGNFQEIHTVHPETGELISIDKHPRVGEVFTKPSMTIPGQTLGLQEILERYRAGRDVVVYKGVQTDVPPEIERMDKIDRIEALREVKRNIVHQQRVLAERSQPKVEGDNSLRGE